MLLEGVALLIGVNNYTGDGFEKLSTAGQETIEMLKGLLLKVGIPMSNIIVRIDQPIGDLGKEMPVEMTSADDRSLKEAAKEFQALLKERSGKCWALFSFSGHGLQIENEQYLLGSDVSLEDFNTAFDGIRLSEHVLEPMSQHAVASLAVLNCCRNDVKPWGKFAGSMPMLCPMQLLGSRSVSLPKQQEQPPDFSGGVFVCWATRPHTTVPAVNNFTVKLAEYLFDRGESVETADEMACRDVGNEQETISERLGVGSAVDLRKALKKPLAKWSELLLPGGSAPATAATTRCSSDSWAMWKYVLDNRALIPKQASGPQEGGLEGLQWSTCGGEMETPAAGLPGVTGSCAPQCSDEYDAVLAATERLKQEEAAMLAAKQRRKEEEEAALVASARRKQEEEAALAASERRKQEEEAALAASERRKQEEEAVAAAVNARKAQEEAAAAAAAERKKQEEAAAAVASERRKQEEEEALAAAPNTAAAAAAAQREKQEEAGTVAAMESWKQQEVADEASEMDVLDPLYILASAGPQEGKQNGLWWLTLEEMETQAALVISSPLEYSSLLGSIGSDVRWSLYESGFRPVLKASCNIEQCVSENALPYVQLCLQPPPPPSGSGAEAHYVVEAVTVVAESHDQGWSRYPEDHHTYGNSWTWAELRLRHAALARPDGGGDAQLDRVYTNLHAVSRWQEHFRCLGPDSLLVRELNELVFGPAAEAAVEEDKYWLDLRICAQFPGWIHYVRRGEVVVHLRPVGCGGGGWPTAEEESAWVEEAKTRHRLAIPPQAAT